MIVVRLHGGLGNQLFQYAFARALSVRHDAPLAFNVEALLDSTPRPFKAHMAPRRFALHPFNVAGRIAERSEIPFLYRMRGKGRVPLIADAVVRRLFSHPGKERSFSFDPDMLLLGPSAYVDGAWQSYKYFAGIEDILAQELSLKEPFAPETAKLAEEMRAPDAAALHVRRGDYAGNRFYCELGVRYYREAIARMRAHRPIARAYVFSDDPAWCREHLDLGMPMTVVGPEHAGPGDAWHLMLLAAAPNIAIANSTFSWWGAWLGDRSGKIVIAPDRWFADPSMPTGDLIPETWIRI